MKLSNKWYVSTSAYWIIAKGGEEEVRKFMTSHSPNEPITELRAAKLKDIKTFYQMTGKTSYNN